MITSTINNYVSDRVCSLLHNLWEGILIIEYKNVQRLRIRKKEKRLNLYFLHDVAKYEPILHVKKVSLHPCQPPSWNSTDKNTRHCVLRPCRQKNVWIQIVTKCLLKSRSKCISLQHSTAVFLHNRKLCISHGIVTLIFAK